MSDAVDPAFVAALSQAVSAWRLQENVQLSFFTAYLYYVLTTFAEEARVMGPQKWRFGRISFTLLRYGTLILVITELTRNFRTYSVISPVGCKALFIINDFLYRLAVLLGNCTLGLCLAALIGAKQLYFGLIMVLCLASPTMGLVFNLIGDIQYPAQAIGPLDEELGYPCYVPENEEYYKTIGGLGQSARSYIYFSCSVLLLALAVATFVSRYRRQRGRLALVLRRDGGAYYLAVAMTQLCFTVLSTPSLVAVNNLESNTAYIVFINIQSSLMPILAQRLVINMRKVDYLGSAPLASTLMFAPDAGSSTASQSFEADIDGDPGHPEKVKKVSEA